MNCLFITKISSISKNICNSEYRCAILDCGGIHLGNPGPPVALQTVAQTEIHEEISYTVLLYTIWC